MVILPTLGNNTLIFYYSFWGNKWCLKNYFLSFLITWFLSKLLSHLLFLSHVGNFLNGFI